MGIKEKLNSIAVETNLFPDLTIEEKETQRIQVELSSTILKRRRELHISQTELAKALNVQQSLVSQWESGTHNFTIKSLIRILAYLKLRLNISVTSTLDQNSINTHTDYVQVNAKENSDNIIFFKAA